jgi:uncharacterized protein (TIGR03790 family)
MILVAFVLCVCTVFAVMGGTPPPVVVLANGNVPASLELARYYMARRSIPTNRLCVLDLPRGETIVRADYETRLRDPLLRWLRENELIEEVKVEGGEGSVPVSKDVRYVVSMYGVPVSITSFSERLKNWVKGEIRAVERAAVDSELSVLLLVEAAEARGPLRNPLFAARVCDSENEQVLLCTRLDGASADAVRTMIDGTLEAEQFGLNGYAWFDARGLSRGAPYFAGDYMIEEAYQRFRREGFECYFDAQEAVLGQALPLDHAAVYMGWYTEHVTGPFLRRGFRFEPGAVAYHLHSASARRLRTPNGYWAGPLTARGAAVTMGAVAEPFLRFTPDLGIFSDRLCRGYTFGESAYMALPALSWQITVVGDPLYRPFGASLEEQVARMRAAGNPGLAWGILRQVNRLLLDGRFGQAVSLCSREADELNSHVLRERLADLYVMNGNAGDALALYKKICTTAASDALVFRAGMKYAGLLRRDQREADTVALMEQLRERLKGRPDLLRALNE